MKKVVVAITGASGSIYASRLMEKMKVYQHLFLEISVVFSTNATEIWEHEMGFPFVEENYPFKFYKNTNFYAPFASGSAGYDQMVIVPCSMGNVGRIATGVSSDLISRAADVMLKERKELIIVPRETPYSLIHLRNMTTLAESGAILLPATPSFYSNPKTLEEIADTVVDRIFDHLGVDIPHYRWGSEESH